MRAAFLVTDAEDQTSFEDVPFGTMTLLSSACFTSGLDSQKEGDGIEGGEIFMLGCVSRVTLPSKYRRDTLYVDIIPLRKPGCSDGIIAGDFNAISPEDDGLVDKNELVDAWVALHGRADPDGATWGVGVE